MFWNSTTDTPGSLPSHSQLLLALLVTAWTGGIGLKPAMASGVAADSSSTTSHPATSDPDSSSLLPRGVRDTVTVLPPVQVAAPRSATTTRETATSVRVDRAAATRFLPNTVGDALATVPGVDLVKTGPWATRLSLRGLYGDRVLFLVDGVRMNSLRGHGTQLSLVSLDRISAIEVMPGAASAQFGTNALAGVVNVITHRSLFSDTPQSSVVLGARGSEPGGSYTESARVRFLTRNAGIEVMGGLGRLDHLRTPDGIVPNSGNREDNYAVRGGARFGSASLDVEHSHHAARDVGLPGFTGGAVIAGSYPLQGRDAQRVELAVKGNGALPDLRVLGVHQQLRNHFAETSSESTFVRGRFISTRTREGRDRVTTRATSIEPSLFFGGPLAVRAFGEYRHETASGPLLQEFVTRDRDGNVTASNAFVTQSVAPAKRDGFGAGISAARLQYGVRLESSVRYDELESRAEANEVKQIASIGVTDRRWTADLGAARAIGPVEPYAHFATGFRAPNLDERFYDGNVHGGLRLFGNPELESEHGRSYELGVRATGDAHPWLRSARISAYRSDVRDLISFRYIGQLYLIPRFQYFNVRDARIEGLEATVQLRAAGFELGLNGSLPRSEDRATGKPLDDAGATRASIELSAPVRRVLPNGGVGVRGRWIDAVKDVSEALRTPAFWTTSVQADCVIGGVRAVLAINNLWNNAYREPMSFIAEPGRTYAFSLYRDFSMPLSFSKE